MDIYDQIVARIIKEQELLMGPIAWIEAAKVRGLLIKDKRSGDVSITNGEDDQAVINSLVDRFGNLFGRAGREVCREAVTALLADLKPSQVPLSLK